MSSIFTFDPSPPHPESPWNINRPAQLQKSASSIAVLTPTATHLDPEPQNGPIEYKLHLLRTGKTPIRMSQLTTQLHWRLQQSNPCLSALQESQGALYELGVNDDGTFVGLLEDEVTESLDTLREMAARLGCGVWERQRLKVGEWRGGKLVGGAGEDREDMGKRRIGKEGGLYVVEAYVKPIVGDSEDTDPGNLVVAAAGRGISASPSPAPQPIQLGSSFLSAAGFSASSPPSPLSSASPPPLLPAQQAAIIPSTEQLKISLTGTTTAGKSTLLGTLTTSQTDNGRGRSRLSLFRHRHELVSGVTSSVAQELIGYRPYSTQGSLETGGEVVNYAAGNVSSWTDIHSACDSGVGGGSDDASSVGGSGTVLDRKGRVVFLSDTAGHPRYRRTTIRSLLGWAPHYALLLIPGDEPSLSEASRCHLDLVLKLGLRMVVAITKIDVARRDGLKVVFKEVLEALREGGRTPVPVMGPPGEDAGVGAWSGGVEAKVRSVCGRMGSGKDEGVVPVVFISSVSASGIGLLHSLLRNLPIPNPDAPVGGVTLSPMENVVGADTTSSYQAHHHHPATLFHTEEVYALPSSSYGMYSASSTAEYSGSYGAGGGGTGNGNGSVNTSTSTNTVAPGGGHTRGAILSGHLRYGTISVGDELLVGPFPTATTTTTTTTTAATTTTPFATTIIAAKKRRRRGGGGISGGGGGVGVGGIISELIAEEGGFSATSDESDNDILPIPGTTGGGGGSVREEWRLVKVVSLRRLRLPVATIFPGDAGTVGVVLVNISNAFSGASPPALAEWAFSPRKGMVVVNPAAGTGPPGTAVYGSGGVGFGIGAQLRQQQQQQQQNQNQTQIRGYSGLQLAFESEPSAAMKSRLVVGGTVVVYCASVRAAARVVDCSSSSGGGDGEEGAAHTYTYTLRFVRGVEWVEAGAKVLVVVDLVEGGGGGDVAGDGGEMGGVGVGRVVRGVV
ncbi:hypothetical protein DFH27DRAFT_601632 [Peziza echinospora]|nr:hypothetical protein DFH27DRAFT_601632 [Peziza echinospora]